MTQTPDFDLIGTALDNAEPIPFWIEPMRAFCLLAQLQFALRHPENTGASAAIAREIAQHIQEALGAIHPEINRAINMVWNPQFDMTRQEYEKSLEVGQVKKRIEIHTPYTLYELDEDGSELPQEEKLLSPGDRPQDWGDIKRWFYQRCTVEFELSGRIYINHCHLWQQVDRTIGQALAQIGEAVTWAIQPGAPPELCGREFLDTDDFWNDEWGDRPPVWENPNPEYFYDDPVVLFDPVDGPITDSQLRQIVETVRQEFGYGEGMEYA